MILLISILVLIGSAYLFKKAAGSISIQEINMVSYIFYSLIIWAFFGSVMMVYDYGVPDTLPIPQPNVYRVFGWSIIMYSMITVPLGMLIVQNLFKIKSMRILLLNYKTSPWSKKFGNIGKISFKRSLLLFSILSVIINIYGFATIWDKIPFVNLFFRGSSITEAYLLRSNIRLFNVDNIVINTFLITISSFSIISAYISFIYWKINAKFIDLMWFILMITTSFCVLLFDLSKGRVLFFLIGYLIIHPFIFKKIKIKYLLLTVVCGILIIGTFYVYFFGAFEKTFNLFKLIENGFIAIKGRVIFNQISGMYYSFDIFPDKFPFIGFASTGKFIHNIFGLEFLPDYGLIIRYLTVKNAEISGWGQHTTIFLGEAWSNFGYFGIILAPFLVGIVIQSFNLYFLRRRKTPFHLALYAHLTLLFPILSGFRSFYYPAWLFQLFVLLFMIIIFALIITKKPKISEAHVIYNL